MQRALLAATLALLASPALADAITYSGTLGGAPIVLELMSDPATDRLPPSGRYFYVSKGIDIPLTGMLRGKTKLQMVEDAPCTETTCAVDDDGKFTKAALNGLWLVAASADGTTLTGDWTSMDKKTSLPIALTKVGSRKLPDGIKRSTPLPLLDIVVDFAMGNIPITQEASPYDYLRMDVPQDKTEPQTMEGNTFQYLSDPRTKFPFPTIVSLADGSDPAKANAFLQTEHWSFNADAFDCEARQYPSFEWNPMVGTDAGTYGGYTEDEFTEVVGLTPTILSFLEGGSTDCGYPHPNNHANYNNVDVATGKPLDLGKIFLGWRPRGDANGAGPSAALVDFVRSHLTDPNLDLADDESCGYDNLVATNLAVAFKPNNTVLLTLDRLDYSIQACGADLWEGPITELKPYLALTAARYFPVLKN